MEKEQPAGSAEANTLLTTLLGQAPASVPAAGSTSVSRRRRRANSTYDRVTRSIGLVVALWTTAAGVVLVIPAEPVTAWLIGLSIGVALALLPEKGARVIWRLLHES